MELQIYDFLFYIVAGAGVGLAVGLTGVGGGSLMTPLLIFSGVPEKIAIGTDLLYAAITKSGGAITHKRMGTVNWKLVYLLASGSIPASLLTSYLLHSFGDYDYSHILSQALGIMLIVTAVVILLRKRAATQPGTVCEPHLRWFHNHANKITVLAGFFLGVLVTLSSVGAGAFCAVLLMILYPRLPAIQVVGTDIAHAVPLTLIGGLGHLILLDNVDLALLGGLLVGSLPAVHVGAKFAAKIPNNVLQPILAILLLVIGLKFLFF